MYQALYRKWRPRTFDDVVGQSHITDTLKRQVSGDRLSHAYLFTGTRGTGKTTCAKILARAVNCQNPQNGNPCNQCPACLGIENGSILDVLELDAASNNGVDQVRALRDEAVYTPAAVRKRVYIVDEVHMLSTPAFNALLKILEEPPAHLMFILATTELHKVPATIKSRCQQFSFKRILPGQIAQRLEYVAEQEKIDLTPEGAALLARLADGGLRDAMSLLDQCSGGTGRVDEQEILDTLGLAGNIETAALIKQVAHRDTAGALETLGRLYGNGKDVGSVLGEMSALARDLLLRKTAPRGCAALLTGGYDEATMRALGEALSAQRLLQMLELLQKTGAELSRSSNRRTDAELCLIRMCDESLDSSFAGLAARVASLEERMAGGVNGPAIPDVQVGTQEKSPVLVHKMPEDKQAAVKEKPDASTDVPPWKVENSSEPVSPVEEPRRTEYQDQKQPRPAAAPAQGGGENRTFWASFAAGLRGKVPPSVMPYLNNPAKVTGVWKAGVLTLWVDTEFTRSMLNKPAVLDGLTQAAQAMFGGQPRVSVVTGKPPESEQPVSHQEMSPAGGLPPQDALDELLAFGEQYDNIIIK